ncbi:hypothetical protein K456DRAFT_100896 [Colletotrichum gloeosporioides 23]|nr:hypothetical protein K456DRAFT_100896 [Colletotrichum gloeosporioides 23]
MKCEMRTAPRPMLPSISFSSEASLPHTECGWGGSKCTLHGRGISFSCLDVLFVIAFVTENGDNASVLVGLCLSGVERRREAAGRQTTTMRGRFVGCRAMDDDRSQCQNFVYDEINWIGPRLQ